MFDGIQMQLLFYAYFILTRSLQFNLQHTDDDNRSYRNVSNMLTSFSLVVIFIILVTLPMNTNSESIHNTFAPGSFW